jgi:23S rRNA pseudouridine2605 synthase
MGAERLQKVLAGAGVASRRDSEALIASGRVKVNGQVVCEMGVRVDPERDEVRVDDQVVRQPETRTYIMLNKPVGVVSTVDDPHGRQTVVDLVDIPTRLFPVGRLDVQSEGLLLLTNDGALTHRLTHPRFEIEKEYHALLDDMPDAHALQTWRAGVVLNNRPTAPATVEVLRSTSEGTWIRVILHEGRKRQIREVAQVLGYTVLRLIRVREGSLLLDDLATGGWRPLTEAEIQLLQTYMVDMPAEASAGTTEPEREDDAPARQTSRAAPRHMPQDNATPAGTPRRRPASRTPNGEAEPPDQLPGYAQQRPPSEPRGSGRRRGEQLLDGPGRGRKTERSSDLIRRYQRERDMGNSDPGQSRQPRKPDTSPRRSSTDTDGNSLSRGGSRGPDRAWHEREHEKAQKRRDRYTGNANSTRPRRRSDSLNHRSRSVGGNQEDG